MSAPLSRQELKRLSSGSLAAVHRRWGTLNEAQGAWLTKQGVSAAAVLEPTPIGATWVRFLDGNTFDVAETGLGALTFRVSNVDGDDIDLAALVGDLHSAKTESTIPRPTSTVMLSASMQARSIG